MIGKYENLDTIYVKMGEYVLDYSYYSNTSRTSVNDYVDTLVVDILDYMPNVGYKYLYKDQNIRTFSLIGKGDPKEILNEIYGMMAKKLSKKHNKAVTITTDFYRHNSITGVLSTIGSPMKFEYKDY